VNIYYVAAIWLGMALIASLVSIKLAVPAALAEIVVGALAGNTPGLREHITQTDVVVFLASVGSLVLTFGLTHHLITKAQYTELVTVVILSAFVPTLIAQQLFRPVVTDPEQEEALGEEDVSIIHRTGGAGTTARSG
jgi:Kef-type K+ transport system membrane component KefB